MTTEPMYPNPATTGPTLRVVQPVSNAQRAETVADLAGTYSRQVDELAAMVEAEETRAAAFHACIADALGELHTALDELAARGAEL